jgi:hypothetical protein
MLSGSKKAISMLKPGVQLLKEKSLDPLSVQVTGL